MSSSSHPLLGELKTLIEHNEQDNPPLMSLESTFNYSYKINLTYSHRSIKSESCMEKYCKKNYASMQDNVSHFYSFFKKSPLFALEKEITDKHFLHITNTMRNIFIFIHTHILSLLLSHYCAKFCLSSNVF